MPYSFVISSGPRAGLRLPLTRHAPVILGRGMESDVVLPQEDRFVSRRHARVEVLPDGVYLHDLAERKSTSVNGMTVRWARLAPGNVVRLGNTLLRLIYEGTDGPAPTEGADDVSVYEVEDASQYQQVPVVSPQKAAPMQQRPSPDTLRFLEGMTCDTCGKTGAPPPSPDLWDAPWLCPDCQQQRRQLDPDSPVRVGRFEILRKLGQGGMGVLLEAVTSEGIHAVVKMLRAPDVAKKTLDRFLREQRIAAALRHPNIVRCFEVGTHDNRPYIASEFISGGNAVEFAGPEQPLENLLWLGADLFRALDYAHDLGVVHRDVSPSNVLLTGTRLCSGVRAKLADFGLAKSKLDLQGTVITMSGDAGGTTLTMGPEQVRNFIRVTPSADVYSAAATVFWMLTRDTPLVLPCRIEDAPVHVRTEAIVSPRRRSLAEFRPDVPQPVVQLLDGLLTHDATVREQMHAKEIAAMLREFAERAARAQLPIGDDRGGVEAASRRPRTEASPDRFAVALTTLEQFVTVMDRHVELAAEDVRAAMESEDPERIERAVARHQRLREDVEGTVARWEELVSLS